MFSVRVRHDRLVLNASGTDRPVLIVETAYSGRLNAECRRWSDHVLKAMIAALLVLAAAIQPSNSTADDWAGPVTLTRFSDDGGFFVRITPGNSTLCSPTGRIGWCVMRY